MAADGIALMELVEKCPTLDKSAEPAKKEIVMRKCLIGLLTGVLILLPSLGFAGPQSEETEETVTLEFLHAIWLPEMQEVLKEAIADFEEQNPNIKVNATSVPFADLSAQTMITLIGGEQLDLVMSNLSRGAAFRANRAWANLEELADPGYWDRYIGPDKITTSFDGYRDAVQWDGSTWGLFYRKDLFEQAGLDPNTPPETWDDLITYATALTKDTNGDGEIDQWGFAYPGSGYLPQQFWVPLMLQLGNPISELDGDEWISIIDSPEGMRATTFMTELVTKHRVTPREVVGMDWEQTAIAFAQGEVAMFVTGSWVLTTLKDGYPDIVSSIGTAPYPYPSDGQPAVYGGPQTIHIPQQSQYKEEAWKFLEFMETGDPSYVDRFGLASNSPAWNRNFLKTDFATDPLTKTFVEIIEYAHMPPQSVQWDSFQANELCPTLQSLAMGEMSVDEAVEYLDKAFVELH